MMTTETEKMLQLRVRKGPGTFKCDDQHEQLHLREPGHRCSDGPEPITVKQDDDRAQHEDERIVVVVWTEQKICSPRSFVLIDRFPDLDKEPDLGILF
ncbi:hypothetical protein F2P81_016441 [Scophthalmus maximus]|uniref:Uncharacterized protein n=1 Tax=Scophthalmus maximus TaxID=52904 RepID=A0A6A4S9L3_SCOMX|nr:hypothetical protein F2P81_016441 [Scophthalmus maximus]